MDSHLFKYRLKLNSEKVVEEWLEFAKTHRQAIIESMRKESIQVEDVFLEQIDNDLYLYYYVRTENLKKALETFNKSTDFLGEYQKTFFQTVTASRTEIKRILSLET